MPRAPSVALAGISLHEAPPSPAATCLHPNAQPCRRLPNCETEDVCDPQRQVSGEDGQGRPIARRFLLPRWYDSSYEGRLLNVFLFDLLAYKAFADGRIRVIGYLCDWLMSIYKKPVLDNAFLDWQLVRKKAAKMVEEMAYKAPELRDRMQYPRSRNSLYHFIPIGSKRRVKHVNRKQQSTDLAQFYLQMKKRISKGRRRATDSSI